ncbi:MAG: hypothetical protein AAGA67_06225, partial [Cyanobacteria bacterium P01_F01_bin.153]
GCAVVQTALMLQRNKTTGTAGRTAMVTSNKPQKRTGRLKMAKSNAALSSKTEKTADAPSAPSIVAEKKVLVV